MKTLHAFRNEVATALTTLALLLLLTSPAAAVDVGIGQSTATDAKTAGAEAAAAAKKALGGAVPKLALVYHAPGLAAESEKLLEGVTSVFDARIVHGCNAYATLTHDGADAQVAILALGGDIEVTATAAKTEGEDDDVACGKKIGESLSKVCDKLCSRSDPGRVVLLFGDCHVPRNNQVAEGVHSALGDGVRIIGGAAYKSITYFEGKPVENSNVGILVAGDFACSTALKQDNSPEGLITSAKQAFEQTVGDDREKVVLTFAFDCGGRRGMMLKNGNFDKELEAMRAVVGDTPVFGFYGSGEIGCPTGEAAPSGVGHHISTCTLKK